MKKQALTFIATLGFLIMAAAGASVHAQPDPRITINLPFEFTVGKETLPAGKYTVKFASRNTNRALLIHSDDRRFKAITLTNDAAISREGESAKMTFRRHGNQYFLASVVIPGISSKRELPMSEYELRLVAKERLAKGATTQPEIIEVVAARR